MAPWDHDVASLVNGSTAVWHQTVVPLSRMVKLTYTATFGACSICSICPQRVILWARVGSCALLTS